MMSNKALQLAIQAIWVQLLNHEKVIDSGQYDDHDDEEDLAYAYDELNRVYAELLDEYEKRCQQDASLRSVDSLTANPFPYTPTIQILK